jgi:ketosteroid isomerase-like protein
LRGDLPPDSVVASDRRKGVADSLEQQTRGILRLLDAMDLDALSGALTDDAQGVDEISRSWTRGRDALNSYFKQLEGTVSDVHSEIADFHERIWSDVGLVTFVLEQTYRIEDQAHKISAPTSMLYRREGEGWKLAMVHSVPIPDEE